MRAFIAIDLEMPPGVRELQEKLGCRAKLVEPENFHITLKFLGEISSTAAAEAEMDRFEGSGGFSVELRGLGAFPRPERPRVLWVGVSSGRLEELGRAFDGRFTPHATIARIKGPCDLRPLLAREWRFGSQPVSTIKLKESILTPRGPIYKDLYEVKL